jgi:hypothetical protein
MAPFVEFYMQGRNLPVLINTAQIVWVEQGGPQGCVLFFAGGERIAVAESYEHVAKVLEAHRLEGAPEISSR